jgi:hypothetical protein
MAIACSLLMAATVIGSTGCNKQSEGEKEQKMTVMNVSLNPEVEFLLDVNNKVISVNALNEEGNLIISAEAFDGVEGKAAEEAAVLFVEVAKDTGYLISGNIEAGDNNVNFSFSGDTEKAQALYNEIKADVTTYLEGQDITATLGNIGAITDAQVKALVAECAPYLETAKMEYNELVQALAESRKETAEFYSQELKTAYYEAKAFAMEQAELEVMREKLNVIQQAIFDGMTTVYNTTIETIESTRKALLVDENSIYQLALKSFREAKVDYLNYKNDIAVGDIQISIDVTAQLENYKQLVADAEEAILKAGADANKTLDGLKKTVTGNYNKMVELLEQQSVNMEEHLPAIAEKRQQAQAKFFTSFENNYAAAIAAAETSWTQMAAQLQTADAE